MEKDADAYRTISEVAETLDIPPHVLRFWETKFPQIKPLKRGGGRRYYRRGDTELLRTIRRLLYDEGYTIRGVQRLLRAKGAGAVAAMPPGEVPPAEEPRMAADADGPFDAMSAPSDRSGGTVSRLQAEIAACRALLDDVLGSACGGSTQRLDAHEPQAET